MLTQCSADDGSQDPAMEGFGKDESQERKRDTPDQSMSEKSQSKSVGTDTGMPPPLIWGVWKSEQGRTLNM